MTLARSACDSLEVTQVGNTLWRKASQMSQLELTETYDEVAHTYEAVLEAEGCVLPQTMLKRILVSLEPGFALLDFGAGTGSLGAALRKETQTEPHTHLVATDVSNGMLDKARAHGAYNNIVCGDLAEDAVRNDVAALVPTGYHIAVANGVLAGGAPVRVEAIDHIISLLRPGGIFFFNVRPKSEGGPELSALYTRAVEAHPDVTVQQEQIQAWREDVDKDHHTLWIVTKAGRGKKCPFPFVMFHDLVGGAVGHPLKVATVLGVVALGLTWLVRKR